MSEVCMVFMTVPDAQTGATLVRDVVGSRLAACGNLIAGVRSIYRWQGEICDDAEMLVVLKTTSARFPALQERLLSLHPYDCPEVVQVPVTDGNPAYLAWVMEETSE